MFIADGPRDASCWLKSCQLPHNSAETTCTTSPEQIEVVKLEGYSGLMCSKHGVVWGSCNVTIRWSAYNFLFDFNRNYASVLYSF